jgi:glyoxylate/hydroxypyruvate reductase A
MRLTDPGNIGCMTEHVLLYLLSHRRLQETYRRYQVERRWQEDTPPFPGDVPIAVLGLGSIGQRLAEVFVDLGYRVNGWARSSHRLPGVDCYHGRDQLAACLAPCDYVVCILPETSDTRDIIDARTLGMMKRGAYFINVGRGGLVARRTSWRRSNPGSSRVPRSTSSGRSRCPPGVPCGRTRRSW